MALRKISSAVGDAALQIWRTQRSDAPSDEVATAVRYTLQLLANQAPGSTVEVRVPPFGAVQCVEGPKHTRGTPPNVIEMTPDVWLRLAVGETSWQDARERHLLTASGSLATLEGMLPVVS